LKALVTGASRGIGAAIARRLAGDGLSVFVNYSASAAAAGALARELGGAAVRADVSKHGDVAEMYGKTGGVDVLVCNAGVSAYGLLTDMSESEIDRVIGVNLRGAINCARVYAPYMVQKRSGVVLMLSSIWGITGASCEAVYSASKAGLIGLGKALAKELAPSGVRVNCIAPGIIETAMLSGFSDDEKAALAADTPLGRLGTPEDVANLAAFLCSEAASFITGQVFSPNGGYVI
jgi:3-oxoacyl-[acyl-carrier protein] reductase